MVNRLLNYFETLGRSKLNTRRNNNRFRQYRKYVNSNNVNSNSVNSNSVNSNRCK